MNSPRSAARFATYAVPHASASLTIGQLAEAGGVGVETVRYYQRRGLLAHPAAPSRCPIVQALVPR